MKFNGVSASFSVLSSTQIAATVPAGATTGPISVTTPGGTVAGGTPFTVTTPAPTITNFAPLSGPVGTSVTITGTNLTGATTVKFNGVSAAFTPISSTQLSATVPAGATTGPISVTTPGGTAAGATSFSVPPTVSIIATSPIATETAPKTGTSLASRTPSSSAALTVFYSSTGRTATPGVDYVALPGSATIAAGASSVTIPVTLIGDSVFERNETIVVTLIANAAYVVGTPSSATVTIVSDDFSEPTPSPQATPIKAMHVTELRNAIDDARTRHGLAALGWTNAPLVPGSTPVKALHLTELRTALSQAYQQVGKPLPNYAEAIVARGTMIKASHLTELRILTRNLE